MSSGSRAKRVSRRSIRISIVSAMIETTVVLTRYMIAGPITMRTAGMSFVARLISSPVGTRW